MPLWWEKVSSGLCHFCDFDCFLFAGKTKIKQSPGVVYLKLGKNREGYWNSEQMEKQTEETMITFETIHPRHQLAFEVDHSSGHLKHKPDGLSTASKFMSV